MGKSLVVFRNSFLLHHSFGVEHAKIYFKNVLCVVFFIYKIEVYFDTNWSAWIEKALIEIFLTVDFLRNFKNIAFFEKFRDFWNLSVAHAKIVKCTYFIWML